MTDQALDFSMKSLHHSPASGSRECDVTGMLPPKRARMNSGSGSSDRTSPALSPHSGSPQSPTSTTLDQHAGDRLGLGHRFGPLGMSPASNSANRPHLNPLTPNFGAFSALGSLLKNPLASSLYSAAGLSSILQSGLGQSVAGVDSMPNFGAFGLGSFGAGAHGAAGGLGSLGGNTGQNIGSGNLGSNSGTLGAGLPSWVPGSPGGVNFGSVSGLGLPDPTMFPTGSLALSSVHRRRRNAGPIRSSSGTPNSPNKGHDSHPASPDKANVSPDLQKSGGDDQQKDDAYWERRRRNNEAAKRSRDARRAKEEDIAMRATILEQENLKLRAQVAILKNETAKLHIMLFSNATQQRSHLAATPNNNNSSTTQLGSMGHQLLSPIGQPASAQAH